MKRALIILATILGGFALLLGIFEGGRQLQWWGEPDELRAIKREKVVDGLLLGLELIERDERGKYGIMKADSSASVKLVFRSDDPTRDRDRIIQFAKSDGWAQDNGLTGDDDWWGRKTSNDGRHQLAVSIVATKTTVTVEVL